ncbi:MAG: hypothetical protein WAZ27_03610 [Minisyncoccia bacterium]
MTLVYAGLSTSPYVNGAGAYAHYMPPGYAVKQIRCQVSVWGVDGYSYYAKESMLACSLAMMERDASLPIQWDPANVQLLSRAPE